MTYNDIDDIDEEDLGDAAHLVLSTIATVGASIRIDQLSHRLAEHFRIATDDFDKLTDRALELVTQANDAHGEPRLASLVRGADDAVLDGYTPRVNLRELVDAERADAWLAFSGTDAEQVVVQDTEDAAEAHDDSEREQWLSELASEHGLALVRWPSHNGASLAVEDAEFGGRYVLVPDDPENIPVPGQPVPRITHRAFATGKATDLDGIEAHLDAEGKS